MKSCSKFVTAGVLFVVIGLTHDVSARGLRRLSAVANCEFAVALNGSDKLNADCTEICKSRHQDMETEGCGYVEVRDTAEGIKADRCFSGHIYGYVEGEEQRVGIAHYKNIESAHECQQLCQKNENCVNFIWTKPQVGGDYKPNCSLKSQVYLDKAWLGSGEFNDGFCNREMSKTCYEMQHYECMGVNTCIWCAKSYLSGPPRCHVDSLGPAAGPEGYPICDGIPDYEYSTTPNPEKPTRPPFASTLPWVVPGQTTTTTASTTTTPKLEDSTTTKLEDSTTTPSVVETDTTDETSVESSSTESTAASSTEVNASNSAEDFVPVTEESIPTTEGSNTSTSTTTAASAAGTIAGAVAGTGAVVAAAGYGVASFVGSSASAADLSIGQFEVNASTDVQPPEREIGIRVAEDDFL